MKIVTSGSAYLDIDAYAGCIGYAELLNLSGEEAEAASSAPLNESITQSIRKLGAGLVTYTPGIKDEFVLIDVSVERFFDPIVRNGTVVEVIDHHPGLESYWQEKIGDKADIEFIGASCTQIYERWQRRGKLMEMKPGTATMLAAGILDNTLNFNAGVTTERDRNAYQELAKIGSLAEDFPAQYFSECQEAIEADLEAAIRNDAKEMTDTPLMPLHTGQLVIWNGNEILAGRHKTIVDVMAGLGEDWGLNLISISDGKSYLVANNPVSQKKFTVLLGATFTDGVSNPLPMMLRKEILKVAIDRQS